MDLLAYEIWPHGAWSDPMEEALELTEVKAEEQGKNEMNETATSCLCQGSFCWTQHKKGRSEVVASHERLSVWFQYNNQACYQTSSYIILVFCPMGTWGADCTSVTLTPAGSIIFASCMPVVICSSQNHISNQVLVPKNVSATECSKSESQSWLWTFLRCHLRWHLRYFKKPFDDTWWHLDDIFTMFVLHVLYWQTAMGRSSHDWPEVTSWVKAVEEAGQDEAWDMNVIECKQYYNILHIYI